MGETFTFGEMLSSRSVMGATLAELGREHDNIWVITPDIGQNLREFMDEYPERFIDVGLSEQVSMGVASGLAYEGNIVFVSGMLPFLSMRALEQVRTDLCYPNLPVRIVGTHGGTGGNGGSTHYAMEDLGLMTSLVNMTVTSVSDPNMVGTILRQSIAVDGPMYIRMGVGKADRTIYDDDSNIVIGKGIVAREGTDVTLFTHGMTLVQAIEAAEIVAQDGISVRVVDMFTLKPIDTELIRRCAVETGAFVVLEDHLKASGLAQCVANVMADEGIHVDSFERLGIPEVYPGFGDDIELRDKHGFGLNDTVVALRAAAAKKK